MKKLCLLLAALMALSLCGCHAEETSRDREKKSSVSADKALEQSLDALTVGAEEGSAVMVGADGTLTTPENSGMAAILSQYVRYEVETVEEDGDTAVATVNITAPDSVTVLKQVMEVSDDPASQEFQDQLTKVLENEPPMMDFSVEVQLQKTDEGWGIVPSFELSNALTGGLAAEYRNLYEQLMDGMLEGGEQ